MIEKILGSSPRTSVVGYAGAIALGLIPVIQTGQWDVNAMAVAVVVAVLARFARDAAA